MSRKDFELIARVVALAMPDPAAVDIAHEFARQLAGTNSRFDAHRFLNACGVYTCANCGAWARCPGLTFCTPCAVANGRVGA